MENENRGMGQWRMRAKDGAVENECRGMGQWRMSAEGWGSGE